MAFSLKHNFTAKKEIHFSEARSAKLHHCHKCIFTERFNHPNHEAKKTGLLCHWIDISIKSLASLGKPAQEKSIKNSCSAWETCNFLKQIWLVVVIHRLHLFSLVQTFSSSWINGSITWSIAVYLHRQRCVKCLTSNFSFRLLVRVGSRLCKHFILHTMQICHTLHENQTDRENSHISPNDETGI